MKLLQAAVQQKYFVTGKENVTNFAKQCERNKHKGLAFGVL
jgi:hypothetical protein